METLTIDGAEGEGGGQVLRSALALSMVTGIPVRIENVRAKRKKPGLLRQHQTAARAAAAVCAGRLDGDALGSSCLTFHPGDVRGGTFDFDIGTAGSTTLVLQTVLWPFVVAGVEATVKVTGGTHNPMAPPFEFVARSLFPLLGQMGAHVELEMLRPGWYPKGGGSLTARVGASTTLTPLNLLECGPVSKTRAVALISNLPTHVAERELAVVQRELGWRPSDCHIETRESSGPGNALLLEVERLGVTTIASSIAERGKPAEHVARDAIEELQRTLEPSAPVDHHLADQLLIPLALAGGGSFRTGVPTLHTRTNAAIVQRFVPVKIAMAEEPGGLWRIDVTDAR